MPTKRIDEPKRDEFLPLSPLPCLSPDHNVPTHQYFPPGIYEHVCGSCNHKITFNVPFVTC